MTGVLKFVSLICALIAVGGFSGSAAHAGGNGALVVNDLGCMVPDGNGQPVPASNSHVVVAFSANGNTLFRCSATGVPNPAGRAVTWDYASTGLTCGTALGSTTKWHAVVSPSGNVSLVCPTP